MNARVTSDWITANQQQLVAEFARLRALLGDGDPADTQAEVDSLRACIDPPAAIDALAGLFALTSFERDVLLLAAGADMDARLAHQCGTASGQPSRTWASFGLALASLPGAHWSALASFQPLRRWRLLAIDDGPGLIDGRLRPDERIVHFIAGLNHPDHRLSALLRPVPEASLMCPSHAAIAADAALRVDHPRPLPIALCGDDDGGQEDVAAAIARRLGLRLFRMHAADIPAGAAEQHELAVLWQRDALLLGGALLISQHDEDRGHLPRFLARLEGLVIVAGRAAPALAGAAYTINCPGAPEQRQLWRTALGARAVALAPTLDAMASQYRLGARRIAQLAAQVGGDDEVADRGRLLLACRGNAPAMSDLAQEIEPRADWDDLVLPEAQRYTLQQIVVHTRHRITVHHDWGFSGKSGRGLGIATLFWGDSGTGKTLAAEVLALALELALYRIDLSAVVSKYIGETEKNLRKVFDAAEELGAILLFDEADALFGKRSDVKDSHDRYANIEVSYLLQRMESYRGLAILTTNHRTALDSAFARRLRFVVHFPFPDAVQRERIWRCVFPAATPIAGVDYAKLARLAVPGGSIRNIALSAAFLAAEAGTPIGMPHLLRAAHLEAAKCDKPISDAETRGWT